MLIGIVGPFASGKSTAATLLEERGFSKINLTDFLRKEAVEKNLKPDRRNLQGLGNALRKSSGAGVLMERALQNVKDDVVFDGIRNPREVELLKQKGGIILGLDADPKLRFQRAMQRQSRGEKEENAITFEEFMANENRENSDKPYEQQLSTILSMADKTIINDGSIENLKKQILAL